MDLAKDLNNKNQMVRVFALGQINRTLSKFSKQPQLSNIDIRLLKGFYTNAKEELDFEHKLAILPAVQ